jgi:polar amino acid transport system substrate-binding protein
LLRSLITALLLGLLLTAAATAQAQDEDGTRRVVRLTSLEWPPYSGEQLRQQGASVAIVRAALAAMGHALEVRFVPWTQAVAIGQDSGSGYHGYFPEYASADVESVFALSASIGSGPLGFVERRSAPVRWNSLADLEGVPVGVVRGYVNTAEFDALVSAGRITAVPAGDDLTNVRKVTMGRLPLAVIDRNVLEYLMQHERAVEDAQRVVQFNPRLLENKSLHVALQRSEDGAWALRMINEGLQKIDADAIAAPFFE